MGWNVDDGTENQQDRDAIHQAHLYTCLIIYLITSLISQILIAPNLV